MAFIMYWVSWAAGWLAIGLEAICIASALYLAAELAEESASFLRTFLRRGIYTVLVLYTLLMIEGGPPMQICMGIAAHLSLLPLFKTFPLIEPISFTALLPIFALFANHFMWFYYFIRDPYSNPISIRGNSNDVGVQSTIGFFLLFVWGLPVTFFVSMTEAEGALPSNMSYSNHQHDHYNMEQSSSKKGGIFRKIMDTLLEYKEIILGSSGGVNKRR